MKTFLSRAESALNYRQQSHGRNERENAKASRAIAGTLAATFALLAITAGGAFAQGTAHPAASVNPLIGTGFGPGDGVNLYPGATTPFGMVQLSPDTEDHGFGYHYAQTAIKGFSMTHMSGPGCPNEGDVFFQATTGPVLTQISDIQSPYTHAQEKAEPGYYQVRLLQWGINAELSATDRTGVARFTFPADQPANIVVPLSHTLNQAEAAQVRVAGDNRIEGFVENHAFCGSKETYKVYFVMTFSEPFAKYGTWTGDHYDGPGTIEEGTRTAGQTGHEEWVGAYASWPEAAQARTLTAKIGISYVDLAGAEKNLQTEAEGKDFAAIRSAAAQAWNKELTAIEVQGGAAKERTVFYTALYHSMLMPTIFEDADGRYLGFDGSIHTIANGHHVYANYSGWDIYRSEIPLLAMIEPKRSEDMAQSVVLMYQQGGWIDRWPQFNVYTNVMAGSPLTVELATVWLDGLHGFDMKAGWEGMMKDAMEAPPKGKTYVGQEGVDWINKIHYVPEDKIGYGSVSQIQEDAIAYASMYRLAGALGKTDDAKNLYARALYYRNVFNPENKFFQPRNADGTWVPNFNPSQDSHGFIEGTGWHYQTFAPADLKWVVGAMGRDLFNKRMKEFFNYPVPGWYAQYYNPYNETDLQAPFIFNFSGEPWESQRVVRRVLSENYFDGPDGIPGNDDCGEMSSWAVLSMMGIYSVDPSSLAYELVAPVFPRVVVHLAAPYKGKSFSIEAAGAGAKAAYIQSVTLNGKPYAKNWVPFTALTDGGSLHLSVSATPNEKWGAAAEDAPPSLSDEKQ